MLMKNKLIKFLVIAFSIYISISMIPVKCYAEGDATPNITLEVTLGNVPPDIESDSITVNIVNMEDGASYGLTLYNYNDFKGSVMVVPGNYIVSSSKIGNGFEDKYFAENIAFTVDERTTNYVHINMIPIDDPSSAISSENSKGNNTENNPSSIASLDNFKGNKEDSKTENNISKSEQTTEKSGEGLTPIRIVIIVVFVILLAAIIYMVVFIIRKNKIE